MSARKERSMRNRKAHAAERAAALGTKAPDPLDETPMEPRRPLAPIPWNRVELTDDQRRAVSQALLDHYPRNQVAKALGVSVKTLRRLIDEDPELADAADAAREQEEADLRDALMASALKGDTVAALFLLKSRHGYVDRPDGRLKVESGGHGVLVAPMAMEEADFEAMVFRQQARWRERAEPGSLPPDLRTSTPGIEGLRLQRLQPGDRPS
jgi:hypothetical protein